MNNNLYQWHDDRMVGFEMQEINRAVEQDRLLKEAGLLGESLLVRATNGLRKLLSRRKKKFEAHDSGVSQRSSAESHSRAK